MGKYKKRSPKSNLLQTVSQIELIQHHLFCTFFYPYNLSTVPFSCQPFGGMYSRSKAPSEGSANCVRSGVVSHRQEGLRGPEFSETIGYRIPFYFQFSRQISIFIYTQRLRNGSMNRLSSAKHQNSRTILLVFVRVRVFMGKTFSVKFRPLIVSSRRPIASTT